MLRTVCFVSFDQSIVMIYKGVLPWLRCNLGFYLNFQKEMYCSIVGKENPVDGNDMRTKIIPSSTSGTTYYINHKRRLHDSRHQNTRGQTQN
jgi:hypothetical protein